MGRKERVGKGQSGGKEGRNDDKWALIGQSREMKSTEACKTHLSDEKKRNSSRKKRKRLKTQVLQAWKKTEIRLNKILSEELHETRFTGGSAEEIRC